jgi:transglutaminase-like putative cysteine protease
VSPERGIEFAIVHTTEYEYTSPVPVSHHVARLTPRELPGQSLLEHTIEIEPAAAVVKTHVDYYGNTMTFFATQSAHSRLTVHARSRVVLEPSGALDMETSPAWEEAADRSVLPLEVIDCALEVGAFRTDTAVLEYARQSFPPGRRLLPAVADLTARIRNEFTYDSRATTITTPLVDVFETRRGVCQDFARVEIACLRALGLAARYVSGYLETSPPPGQPRLVGADASHAWVSVYCPGHGWIDVDPTNNLVPANSHVTLAWGRDFTDVSPIRGVILGGGDHALRVSVDVMRLPFRMD